MNNMYTAVVHEFCSLQHIVVRTGAHALHYSGKHLCVQQLLQYETTPKSGKKSQTAGGLAGENIYLLN